MSHYFLRFTSYTLSIFPNSLCTFVKSFISFTSNVNSITDILSLPAFADIATNFVSLLSIHLIISDSKELLSFAYIVISTLYEDSFLLSQYTSIILPSSSNKSFKFIKFFLCTVTPLTLVIYTII